MSRSNAANVESIISTLSEASTQLRQLKERGSSMVGLSDALTTQEEIINFLQASRGEKNIHPDEIRVLIYNHYRKFAESEHASQEIINSCITASIALIHSMTTRDYAKKFYATPCCPQRGRCDCAMRLQELANIITAMGALFAGAEKLPQARTDCLALLLPLLKQFQKLIVDCGNKSERTNLSFQGVFYGIGQLSRINTPPGFFDSNIHVMSHINSTCWKMRKNNTGLTITDRDKGLSEVIQDISDMGVKKFYPCSRTHSRIRSRMFRWDPYRSKVTDIQDDVNFPHTVLQ